jgi:YbbR domain-containing protein
MKKLLTHNLTLKIVALGLAIITWLYVNGELRRITPIE